MRRVTQSYLHTTTAVAVDAEPNTSEALEQYGRPLPNNAELEPRPRQVGSSGKIVQLEYPAKLTITQVSPLKLEIVPLGLLIVTECEGLNVKL